MKSYHIVTHGCQMNVHDSEHIAGLLEGMGYTESDDPADANLLIYNSCCVRGSAEQRLWGALGQNASRKDLQSVAVTGCCAQLYGSEILDRFPGVDLVFGRESIGELHHLLGRSADQRICMTGDPSVGEITFGARKPCFAARAWVVLSHGCDNFCSYCVVPNVRGRERCRPLSEILGEVEELSSSGELKEIFLLGQNVNSYQDPGNEKVGFAQALTEICALKGVERVKFITSHPRDLTDDIIDVMASLKALCSFLHLPLQSGSDRILKSMNRGYDRAHYLSVIEKLRSKIPGLNLTTDLMVGFPGETEEDFSGTMNMVECIKFDGAYTFIYCDRPNMKAAGLKDRVPGEVKKQRLRLLAERQSAITEESNLSMVGERVEVLVEGTAKRGRGLLTGRSRGHRVVNFPGERTLVGKLVSVKTTKAGKHSLTGVMVK